MAFLNKDSFFNYYFSGVKVTIFAVGFSRHKSPAKNFIEEQFTITQGVILYLLIKK